MRRALLLLLFFGLLGCSAAPPIEEAARGEIKQATHTPPATPVWLAAGAACPPPPTTPLVLPRTDSWGGLITLKEPSNTLWLAPIHVNITIDGDLLFFGFSRTTGDFNPDSLDVSPTFLMRPDLYSDADTTQYADIYGVPFDGPTDSFVCAGHSLLADGRIITTGGTRIAKFAKSPLGPREFGLTYGAIFGRNGWTRIPRDFIGGEAWYPTLARLSDGRLIQYNGYYELDAELALAKQTFNRTVQMFDPTDLDDPWTVISPQTSTPEGTEPANYTWIWELPTPIQAGTGNREYQLFMMGSGGATYLVNHLETFADPAQRFLARKPRVPAPGVTEQKVSAAATVLLAPYYHEGEKNFWRPGSVISIGGGDGDSTKKEIQLYDPYIDQWCPLARPMDIERRNSVGVYLPDGNIFIVNGQLSPATDTTLPQLTPQILDPRTRQLVSVKPEVPMSSTRGYHNVATLLPDGRVFVGGGRTYRQVGGVIVDAPDERTDGRYYSPYYLGLLAPSDRPAIVGIPKDPVMHYGGDYEVDYKNGAITSAVLIGLSAMTHATDFNSRYVEVEVTGGGAEPRGKVKLRGPLNAKIAPPGHYMLFLNRKVTIESPTGPTIANVPSVAQIIRVDGDKPNCEGTPVVNACGGCDGLEHVPGTSCRNMCGAGSYKCDSPNRVSCNACL